MKHLIDKDALIAEIKERIDRDNENAASYSSGSEHDYLCRVKEKVYKDLLSFIDTLEVKEIQEPTGNDLEKAAEQNVCEVVNCCSAIGIPNDHIPSWVIDAAIQTFIHGAQWQMGQYEKNRLAACDNQTQEEADMEMDFVMGIIEKEHRQPTFDDAIKYGMKLQKEQSCN